MRLFISYAHTDRKKIEKLHQALQQGGHEPWFDKQLRVGEDWKPELKAQIAGADAFIYALTPESVASGWCRWEHITARDFDKPIFPILFEETELPPELAELHYHDLRTGFRKRNTERLLDSLASLAATISQEVVVNDPTISNYLDILEQDIKAKQVKYYVDLSATKSKGTDNQGSSIQAGDPEQLKQPAVYIAELEESISKATKRYSSFVITGVGGAGKTETLYNLILEAIEQKRQQPQVAPLPVFIRLADWDKRFQSVWTLISDAGTRRKLPAEYLNELLSVQEISLFIDGINEIRGDEKGLTQADKLKELVEWVDGVSDSVKIVMTCRTENYQEYRDRFGSILPWIEIKPLAEDRIREFAEHYLDDASTFLHRLKHRGLIDLAHNPLMLTAFVEIVQKESDLPGNQGLLFQKLLSYRAKREARKKNPVWLPFRKRLEEVSKNIAELVYRYSANYVIPVSIKVDDSLQHPLADNDIEAGIAIQIIERDTHNIHFVHQRYAEYFAALYLWHHPEAISRVLGEAWFTEYSQGYMRRISAWDQPIIMLSGITDDPDELLRYVNERDPWLAAMCIGAAANISEEIYDEVFDALIIQLKQRPQKVSNATVIAFEQFHQYVGRLCLEAGSQSSDINVRKAAVQALGKIRDNRALNFLLEILEQEIENPDYELLTVTVEAVRLFEDPSAIPTLRKLARRPGDYSWKQERYHTELVMALGYLRASDAIDDLIHMEKSSLGPRVDSAVYEALGSIGDSRVIPYLLRHLSFSTDECAHALAELNATEAIEPLLEIARKPSNTSQSVIEALYSLAPEAIHQALDEYGTSSEEERRVYAAKALGWAKDGSALMLLCDLLRDPVSDVRSQAAISLGELNDENAIPCLIQLLADSDSYVRTQAAKALANLNWAPTTVEEKIHYSLAEENRKISVALAKKSPDAILHLRKLLQDQDPDARWFAASVLEEINWVPNSPEDKAWLYVAKREYQACVELGDAAVPALVNNLKGYWRFGSIGPLEEIGAVDAIAECLKEGLSSETSDAWIDWIRDNELGQFRDARILIPSLLDLALGGHELARNRAISILSEFGDKFPRPLTHVVSNHLFYGEYTTASIVEHILQNDINAALRWAIGNVGEAETQLLIGQYESTDDELRKQAILKLLGYRDDSLSTEFLLSQTTHQNINIRMSAVNALTYHTDERIISRFIQMLSDKGTFEKICDALASFGEKAVEILQTTLPDSNPQIRAGVIIVLGRILQAASHESRKRRQALMYEPGGWDGEARKLHESAEALRKQQQQSVSQQIAEYLLDKSVDVRVAAIDALLKIKGPDAGSRLLPMLDDESTKVQVAAMQALGDIGYQDATPNLMSKLDNKTYHVDLPLISMLPIARLCDYALRTLPRCSDKASINAIHRALADGDNLLKAHAVEALGEIKRNIKGKEPYAYIPPESFFNSEIHIPDENGEKVVFWDEVVVSIEEQGITKLLGRLTLDTSPVIEENLSAVLLKEEEKQWLEAVQTEQVDSEEIEALWHDFRQNLMDLWRLPLGYYGVQGLSEIRTPQAIQFLLSALDNSTPIIRAAATGALSSWLCDFPDSGWSRGGSETVRITSESERLRDVAVTKLIDLLHDDTILDMSVELSRISDLAARALKFSGRDAAKSALELWRRADT